MDVVKWWRNRTGLVSDVFGDDEGDVVVLLVGAEALDFFNDGSESSLNALTGEVKLRCLE